MVHGCFDQELDDENSSIYQEFDYEKKPVYIKNLITKIEVLFDYENSSIYQEFGYENSRIYIKNFILQELDYENRVDLTHILTIGPILANFTTC